MGVSADVLDQMAAGTHPLPVLTGPTAVGKTDHSLALAEALGAEIISADSRQVYRGLDIGTAKPSAEELARVPHHFIDEKELGEAFSAGAFARAATARIEEVLARGRVPLIVGGSTLYLHALMHGLADIPPVAAEVRQAVEARLEHEGADRLYDELRRYDPTTAATLDATKTQRLVRALEVLEATGQPLSFYHQQQAPSPYRFDVVVLNRDRAALYARINLRVDRMLEHGLLDEVRGLLDQGYDLSTNPLRTIGYQEPVAFLRGEIDRQEMIRLIKRNTRRYAKRQLTWFRRYPSYRWLPAAAPWSLFFDLQ